MWSPDSPTSASFSPLRQLFSYLLFLSKEEA